jgi:hypothetical protein
MGRVFIGQPANLEFEESKIRTGGQEKPNLDDAFCQHVFIRVLMVRCSTRLQVVLQAAIGAWKIFECAGN